MVFSEQDLADLANPSLPLYYKLMVYYEIAPDSRRDYLQPISVTKKTYRALEGLLMSQGLEERLEVSQRFGLWFSTGAANLLKGKVRKKDYGAALDSDGFLGDFKEEFCRLAEKVCLMFHNSTGGCYDISRQAYDSYVKLLPWRVDKSRSSVMKKLKRTLSNIKQLEPRDDKVAAVIHAYEMVFEEAFVDFWKLRLDRAERLGLVDANVSYAYLAHSPFFQRCLESVDIDRRAFIFYLNVDSVCDYVKRDEQLYRQILGNMKVVEVPKKTGRNCSGCQVGHKKTRYELASGIVRKSVVGDCDLENDSGKRVDYFVKDCLEKGYDSQKVRVLKAAFFGFNLARRMKRRETRLDELQFRNFFDDVLLQFILKGKMPNKQDLDNLYQSCGR